MRRLSLFASLLLLQCGPKQSEDDPDTGSSGVSDRTTTTDDSTTGTSTSGPTEPTTTTTTGAACALPEAGNIWVCECTTFAGPWKPFNEACGRQASDAVEWTEWLCENYADEEAATGFTTEPEAGSTAGGESLGDSATVADTVDDTPGGADTGTAGDTGGSLGCECTCRVTPECCDDSLP